MGNDEAAIPGDETELSTAGSEPLSTAGTDADTDESTTVDDRKPEGDDETVGMEHIDDFRPPTARENLRLT